MPLIENLDNRFFASTERTGHNQALKLAGGTEGCVVRAASEFERIAIAGFLWKFEKPIRTSTARRGRPITYRSPR